MLMIFAVLLSYLSSSETRPERDLTHSALPVELSGQKDPHNDQLPVGLIAQLVEHCTGITEVRFESRSGLSFATA